MRIKLSYEQITSPEFIKELTDKFHHDINGGKCVPCTNYVASICDQVTRHQTSLVLINGMIVTTNGHYLLASPGRLELLDYTGAQYNKIDGASAKFWRYAKIQGTEFYVSDINGIPVKISSSIYNQIRDYRYKQQDESKLAAYILGLTSTNKWRIITI